MSNEPWSVTELWSMGICCCTEQLSAPGPSARAAPPKKLGMHPISCPSPAPMDHVLQLKRVAGLGFVLFPSLHSDLVYLMLLNFSFLKMSETGTGS